MLLLLVLLLLYYYYYHHYYYYYHYFQPLSPIPAGFGWHYVMKQYGPCERFGIFCISISVEVIIIIIHSLHRHNHNSYHHCQHTGNCYINRRYCHHRHNHNFQFQTHRPPLPWYRFISIYLNIQASTKYTDLSTKEFLRANTNLQTKIVICEYIFKDNTKHKTYYPPIFPSIILRQKTSYIRLVVNIMAVNITRKHVERQEETMQTCLICY